MRRGAFEASGLPGTLALEVDERRDFEFALAGGSYSPGLDPELLGRFLLPAHAERAAAALTLGTPLVRVRHAVLRSSSTRFLCLAEEPGGDLATVQLHRRGTQLVAELEHAAGLVDASIAVLLDGEVRYGTRGLRASLPESFDRLAGGVPFSVGVVGRSPIHGRITWRRWAGGLPADLLSGSPGRLFASQRA